MFVSHPTSYCKEAVLDVLTRNCFYIVATALALFLTSIEFTSLGVALPTMVEDLKGDKFIWIGNAYTIASASFIPVAGGLSTTFGRQPIMLLSIALFALGSALAGPAQSMDWMIAARGSYFALVLPPLCSC